MSRRACAQPLSAARARSHHLLTAASPAQVPQVLDTGLGCTRAMNGCKGEAKTAKAAHMMSKPTACRARWRLYCPIAIALRR
jgi:hypothetical protein